MTGLGLVVTWAGYVVLFYGYNLIHGYGLKMTDIASPKGRAKVAGAITAKKQAS